MAKRREMTKTEARAWMNRWKRVNKFERDELRQTSLEEKLRQLAALMFSCDEFGWTDRLAAESTVVRERWQKLRSAYGR
jgi:hypothetical protein